MTPPPPQPLWGLWPRETIGLNLNLSTCINIWTLLFRAKKYFDFSDLPSSVFQYFCALLEDPPSSYIVLLLPCSSLCHSCHEMSIGRFCTSDHIHRLHNVYSPDHCMKLHFHWSGRWNQIGAKWQGFRGHYSSFVDLGLGTSDSVPPRLAQYSVRTQLYREKIQWRAWQVQTIWIMCTLDFTQFSTSRPKKLTSDKKCSPINYMYFGFLPIFNIVA